MIWFNVSPRITKHLLKLDHIYMFMLYTSTMKYYVDPRKIITYGDMVTCIVREIRSEMRNTKVRQLWMLNIWVMRPTATQNFIFICWFQICWNFWGSTNTSVDNSAFKCYFLTFFISNLALNTRSTSWFSSAEVTTIGVAGSFILYAVMADLWYISKKMLCFFDWDKIIKSCQNGLAFWYWYSG